MLHGIHNLKRLNRFRFIWKHRSKFDLVRLEFDQIVDALALNVQSELLCVVLALEEHLLCEGLVTIGSEHHIDGGTLAWKKSAAQGPHVEELSFFLLVLLSLINLLGRVRVVVPPLAGNFLKVFNSQFDSLSGVDSHSFEVKIVGRHVKFRLREVRDEVNHVGWAIFDVDGDQEVRSAELLLLSRSENNCKKLRVVWHDFHSFILIERNAGLTQQFLVEIEVDREFTNIRQAEGAFFSSTNNDIAKVTSVGRELDVFQAYEHAVDLHM